MKLKNYKTPTTKVVKLQRPVHLLAGSRGGTLPENEKPIQSGWGDD
jgi:hypothetical protein